MEEKQIVMKAVNERPDRQIETAIKKGFDDVLRRTKLSPERLVIRELLPKDLFETASYCALKDWYWTPKEKKTGWHRWFFGEINDHTSLIITGVYFDSNRPQLTERLKFCTGGIILNITDTTILLSLEPSTKDNPYMRVKWLHPILVYPENNPIRIEKYITQTEGTELMGLLGHVIEKDHMTVCKRSDMAIY